MERLLHQGNFTHNRFVLTEGKGEVIPVRRPDEETAAEAYSPCPPSLNTLSQRKFGKSNELPDAEGIMKFSSFLSREINKSFHDLEGINEIEERSKKYRRAQSVVLAKLAFFNKRRPGEAEQLTGKRGRKVPLMIPKDCDALMNKLIVLRNSAGISKKKKKFGRFGAVTPIRATDSIRELTQEAGLNSPQLIRLTKVRKYVATMSQVFALNEGHTEWLADRLGHSVRVHKEHYRLPNTILEKAKIAKLLLAIDSGMASSFAGKTLEEITFDGKLMFLRFSWSSTSFLYI
ncbi:hypothetical protein HOLleu_01860 [Holothuria leucospilota]|uniref:Uncharacterized protein n=1 Tax=Holothuria leucospilota TaxID=206669 RepID=A0A9Q1CR00_HOLLE|nr:hypothetical protein HOLleu_01860 [Holothuria leucospilota]